MEQELKFRTKTGYCHILPDKIAFSRSGKLDKNGEPKKGIHISFMTVVFFVIAALCVLIFFLMFQSATVVPKVLVGLLIFFMVGGTLTIMSNTTVPSIDRSKILSLEYIEGQQGLTSSRFHVKIDIGKHKPEERLIILPGYLTGGDEEAEKAQQLFKDQGLLS